MNNLSLKGKLITVVGVLTAISFGVFAFMARTSFDAVKKGKMQAVKTAAEDTLDKIDRNLFERYGDVQAFAVSEPARSGDKARIVKFMADMMPTYAPIYQLMMVVNSKGKVVAVNEVDKDGKPLDTSLVYSNDYSKETWFKKAMDGEIKPATSFVEDLHIDHDISKIYKNEGKVMNFTAPITHPDTGKILGVWTNRVSWADVVEQITKEQLASIKSESMPHVFPYIMNSDGIYLLHPEGNAYVLSKAQEGFQEKVREAASGAYLTENKVSSAEYSGPVYEATVKSKGYSTYPGINWVATVQVPTADPLKKAISWYAVVASALILLSVLFAMQLVGKLVKQFEGVIGSLSNEAAHLNSTSLELSGSSQNLASAATEQASSLQETASSVEEISAMVNKSADSASRSIKVAAVSQDTASKGKTTVDQMINSIEDINQSNAAVMAQFEQSNQQLTNIIKVISEIGSKTKVINDIVFQTKLLSFNASVEAARAGEHGKGFAVVAEEVGNLAQMSGNAAKEIGDMLNESISTVQKIVDDTKGKVERLIAESKTKIEDGITVARECGSVLEEIVKNEGEINIMINEISTAAQEQATGVSEINKAISQLDRVTHQNSSVAETTADQAQNITSRADQMMKQIGVLEVVVRGANGATKRNAGAPPSTPAVKIATHSEKPVKRFSFRKKAAEPVENNVVVLRPPEKAAPKRSSSSELKTAVGSDEVIPSESDARFKDI